jgi:hypothetical protein
LEDYFGAVLNRAARVMSSGHGGQILLDGATAGLLSGVDLVASGPRRLRDLAKPVEMFHLRAPGLRAECPLNTLDPVPGNLWPPTTGRPWVSALAAIRSSTPLGGRGHAEP